MMLRIIGVGLALAVSQTSSQTQIAPAQADCSPNRPAIQSRIDAVAAAPAQFLPKLELARCYDLAWRLPDVEPAIQNALASLRVEARTAQATVSAPAPAGSPLLAGTEIPMPARVHEAPAVYPDRAYVDGITGLVIVEAIIDKSGKVRDAKVAQSVPGLDAAAVTAVRKWRFAPSVSNGQTVEVRSYWPVRFAHARELWASDWLTLGRFYYERGLLQHAVASLDLARDRALRDVERYGEIHGLFGTPTGRPASIPPTKIKDVKPIYPPAAQASRVSGQVILMALIDRFGDVGRLWVVKPLPMLDLAAQEAVSAWKYTPARVNDQPATIVMTVVTSFSLR